MAFSIERNWNSIDFQWNSHGAPIVIALTLCSSTPRMVWEPKKRRFRYSWENSAIIWWQIGGEWDILNMNKFQCMPELIINMLPMLILIWKWLEGGCSSCHIIIIDGKAKFNEKVKLWQYYMLGGKVRDLHWVCFIDLDNFQ